MRAGPSPYKRGLSGVLVCLRLLIRPKMGPGLRLFLCGAALAILASMVEAGSGFSGNRNNRKAKVRARKKEAREQISDIQKLLKKPQHWGGSAWCLHEGRQTVQTVMLVVAE